MIRVSRLTVYPVKSMSGLSRDTLEIGKNGPALDRKWQVVDSETHKTLTQREYPELSIVRPVLTSTADAADLSIGFPDGNRVSLSPDLDTEPVEAQVWSYGCFAQRGCKAANDAISDYLGCKAYFAFGISNRDAGNGQSHARFRGFADKYTLLLLNLSSLDDINAALEAEQSETWPQRIDLSRFRGNIEIEGADSGAENRADGVMIGGHKFDAPDPCNRCKMTRVDQDTGTVRDQTLSKLLRQWNFVPGLGAIFGQYITRQLSDMETISLHVGDEVTFT